MVVVVVVAGVVVDVVVDVVVSVVVVVVVVVVAITLSRIIKSVLTRQAPVTLEWKNTPGKTQSKPNMIHAYIIRS